MASITTESPTFPRQRAPLRTTAPSYPVAPAGSATLVFSRFRSDLEHSRKAQLPSDKAEKIEQSEPALSTRVSSTTTLDGYEKTTQEPFIDLETPSNSETPQNDSTSTTPVHNRSWTFSLPQGLKNIADRVSQAAGSFFKSLVRFSSGPLSLLETSLNNTSGKYSIPRQSNVFESPLKPTDEEKFSDRLGEIKRQYTGSREPEKQDLRINQKDLATGVINVWGRDLLNALIDHKGRSSEYPIGEFRRNIAMAITQIFQNSDLTKEEKAELAKFINAEAEKKIATCLKAQKERIKYVESTGEVNPQKIYDRIQSLSQEFQTIDQENGLLDEKGDIVKENGREKCATYELLSTRFTDLNKAIQGQKNKKIIASELTDTISRLKSRLSERNHISMRREGTNQKVKEAIAELEALALLFHEVRALEYKQEKEKKNQI